MEQLKEKAKVLWGKAKVVLSNKYFWLVLLLGFALGAMHCWYGL